MRVRSDLLRLLPRLRRYARAVVGDRLAADERVADALRTIAAAPPKDRLPPPLALFRELQRAIARSPWPTPGDGGSARAVGPLEAGLRGLDRLDREVLLLRSLEGFAANEIAAVLEVDRTDVERRLHSARARLAGQQRGRVLVCQEDPVLADELARAVREAGHDVVGIAADERAVASLVHSSKADLVFTQISGVADSPAPDAIAAVRSLVDVGCMVVTVACERAMARLAELPIVLVAKPIDPRALDIAFAQALHTRPPREADA